MLTWTLLIPAIVLFVVVLPLLIALVIVAVAPDRSTSVVEVLRQAVNLAELLRALRRSPRASGRCTCAEREAGADGVTGSAPTANQQPRDTPAPPDPRDSR